VTTLLGLVRFGLDFVVDSCWTCPLKNSQTGTKRVTKTADINKKTRQFTTPYKGDLSKVAELKQLISQKMILLRSTVTRWLCTYCRRRRDGDEALH